MAVIAQPAHPAYEVAHSLLPSARVPLERMAAAAGKCGGQLGEPGRGWQRASPSKAEFHMHVSGRSKAQGVEPSARCRGREQRRRARARKVGYRGPNQRRANALGLHPDLNRSIMARSERFELPTLGFEVRCSIQLSYERMGVSKVGPGIPTFGMEPGPKTPLRPIIRVARTELPHPIATWRAAGSPGEPARRGS